MDEKKDDKLGSMRSKSIIYGGDNFSVGCIDLADLDWFAIWDCDSNEWHDIRSSDGLANSYAS